MEINPIASMKAAVSDVRKTPTDTKRRVEDVTNRTSRLEVKHDDTDRRIKDISSKTAHQINTLEKRVRELENEMKKEKTERSADSEASSEARAALQARMEAEVSELKAKIRQVASEHTVMLLSPKIVKQPHAVHMGESQLSISYVSLSMSQCDDGQK